MRRQSKSSIVSWGLDFAAYITLPTDTFFCPAICFEPSRNVRDAARALGISSLGC